MDRRENSPLSPLKVDVNRQLFKERVLRYGEDTRKRLSTDYVNTKISNTLSCLKKTMN